MPRPRYQRVLCPAHGEQMRGTITKYGYRYGCEHRNGCTYVSWNGNTPANENTRKVRIEAHDAFDSLWETKSQRAVLYKRLADWLNLPSADCHIANFDVSMCNKVVDFARSVSES